MRTLAVLVALMFGGSALAAPASAAPASSGKTQLVGAKHAGKTKKPHKKHAGKEAGGKKHHKKAA